MDTSSELRIQRYGNGIKLVKPKNPTPQNSEIFSNFDTGQTVGNLHGFPFITYFSDADNKTIFLNKSLAEMLCAVSERDCIGKTAFDFYDSASAKIIISNNLEVMETNCIKIIEEEGVVQSNEEKFSALSIKMPWYNLDNKIIGLFGCAIICEMNSTATSLTQISQMGLLNTSLNNIQSVRLNSIIKNVNLTNRELEIIRFTLKGYTAKEVGKMLDISSRTVESHIDNIKYKMNVTSKAHLINKIMELYID